MTQRTLTCSYWHRHACCRTKEDAEDFIREASSGDNYEEDALMLGNFND